MPPFNDRLKQLREKAGLTQEGLARAAGLSTSAVSKLEQRGIDPSWSTVLRLAEALSVPVQAFAEAEKDSVGGEEKKPRARSRKGK